MSTAVARVGRAFRAIAVQDRKEIWISLRDEADCTAEAARVDARVAAGERLPLAGRLLAVKDNIDVAGLPTTAGCPSFGYPPAADAPVVARLRAAGAIVIGKTNLDQFATGLVGTRSPYGPVRGAVDPTRISGGSSAGSAVAVALGMADLALGTDTAGSGRVPAAFQGLIGLKPTLGLVPNTGVVPACVDYDAVTVFARELELAATALSIMVGPDPADPRSRTWPDSVPLDAPTEPRIGVAQQDQLAALTPSYGYAYRRAVDRLADHGMTAVPVELSTLLDAALLLYDGAIVAERYTAVGAFLDEDPADADPVVAKIIRAAAAVPAHRLVADTETLLIARQRAAELFSEVDALYLPTTTEHPTLAEIAADPVAINRRLGTYTNFCNLLDLSAVAIPAGAVDGLPFGAMLVGPAFHDQRLLALAGRLLGTAPPPMIIGDTVDLAVFGAHRRGQPLNPELIKLGARYAGEVCTSDAYRLVALATEPGKPGLVRVGPGVGTRIGGERWQLSVGALGRFLAALPAPMSLTRVELRDGSQVLGFGCAQDAAEAGRDISDYGDWPSYLEERDG
ncbi:allophanate hydrolase [Microlunatus sp. GCM10028923]|uniref:allophanate hydrolase n=1 Tax=Microlunatus sp. GCM10028923 TaxID=3273400 RepID=UPI00360773FA